MRAKLRTEAGVLAESVGRIWVAAVRGGQPFLLLFPAQAVVKLQRDLTSFPQGAPEPHFRPPGGGISWDDNDRPVLFLAEVLRTTSHRSKRYGLRRRM
jgi:hypothetical protein